MTPLTLACALSMLPVDTRVELERYASNARSEAVPAVERAARRVELRERVVAMAARTGVAADVIMGLLTRPAGSGGVVTPAPEPVIAPPQPAPQQRLSYFETLRQFAETNVGPEFAALKQDAGDLTFQFVQIQPGEFMMGSPSKEKGRGEDEVLHPVQITRPFDMAVVPLTQWQVTAILGENPSDFTTENPREGGHWEGDGLALNIDHPAESISWDDVQRVIGILNSVSQGCTYRLPTEAEWEYAARAGTETPRWFGKSVSKMGLSRYAWHERNSKNQTHRVGQKTANPWGLYDILGNVWEWVSDYYGPYDLGVLHDPQGPASGEYRVLRGGGYFSDAWYLRSSYRSYYSPSVRLSYLGARLVRTCP